jgi:AAA domain
MPSPLDLVIGQLEYLNCTVKQVSPQQWEAQCPSHDDRHPSLSIGEGDDGRLLLHDHAGCELEEILAALGFTAAELFPDNGNGSHNGAGRVVAPRPAAAKPSFTTTEDDVGGWHRALIARPNMVSRLGELRGWTPEAIVKFGVGYDGERITIPVTDCAGQLTGVGRYQPNPATRNSDRKMLQIGGSERDLFPRPETIDGPEIVWLVEGESDAIALWSLDMPAVGYPGVGKWVSSWPARFAGRRVIVCADCDGKGREAGAQWVRELESHAAEVWSLDLDKGRDDGFDVGDLILDWRAEGATIEKLRSTLGGMAENARRLAAKDGASNGGVPSTTPLGVGTLAPSTESPVNTEDSGVPPVGTLAPPGTLRRCDVRRFLTTDPLPVEWIADGVLARGTLTLLAGREKEGKSLLAMALAARAATGGGQIAGINVCAARALIVDAENGGGELHRRVRALGLGVQHAARIEVYEAVAHDLRRDLGELDALLDSIRPDLLVLDSWRSLWGGDENDSGEVARVLDPLRNMIRRYHAGAILIHHMRKGGGYRGSSAIGASVENVIELSRHDEDPDRRRRRLRNPACRFEQEADDRWLRIEADRERGLLLVDEADSFHPSAGAREDAGDALLAALRRPTAWSEWARDAGLDPKHGTARRARDSLREQGAIAQDADGLWGHADGEAV